ncbi:hypothetical protein [Yoonia sp. 208BN28-4]|uniref:hypothetical protein n=1 Tax=Yoonia sp. 208BN28-4 TaxID=3126505 RepID=UPI0030AAD61B
MTMSFKSLAIPAVAVLGLAACDMAPTPVAVASPAAGLTLAQAQAQYPDLGLAEFNALDIDRNNVLDATEAGRIATSDSDVSSLQDINIDNDS